MRPAQLTDRREESGAYALLYGLLILVVFGVAAIVVDLAIMRENRASTRSATDSAAVAAASALNPLDPSRTDPRKACQVAWRYLRSGIDRLPDGSSSCSTLPTAPTANCSTMTPAMTATWSNSEYVVRVTWPVLASSPLMTKPDVAPGSVTQASDTAFDGVDACERIAVEVEQTNNPAFAGALGVGALQIRSASVGRAIESGTVSDVIAALNILEPTQCGALLTSGQGSILVKGVGSQAGIIATESDGRWTGSSCNGSGSATIEAASNSLNFIRADGPAGPGTGLIHTFALNPDPVGNPAKAYNTGPIQPTPTVLSERYGPKPVLDVFNCTSGSCAAGGSDWIDQLEAAYGGTGTPPTPWSTSTALGSFRVLPGDPAVPDFTCNGTASTPPIVIPTGNWFVNCSQFKVAGLVAFRGGHIVTDGPVELGSNGACLAVNVPVDAASPACPSANLAADPDTTTPAPTGDSILFIRTGRLYKVSQAQLYMPRTFTMLQSGYTELAGGSGALLMTTPLADSAACTTDSCKNQHFRKLVLWSENSSDHTIGGQSALVLRGVLYTPNAKSIFDGQAGQNQADAQFWTRALEVKGQGTLVMAADPDASISRPLIGVSLIR